MSAVGVFEVETVECGGCGVWRVEREIVREPRPPPRAPRPARGERDTALEKQITVAMR